MAGSIATRPDQVVGQSYRDLREWLDLVDRMGELRVIQGADWNLEIAPTCSRHATSGARRSGCSGRRQRSRISQANTCSSVRGVHSTRLATP